MDINLARTFLEVATSGSFILAAERLHLTQTAISARIRTLEEQLGQPLFVRNKAGARLTNAGERFIRHAAALVQVWERARRQVALPASRKEGISLGGELSLWHPFLANWLVWMKHHAVSLALRSEIDKPMQLLARVQEGILDLAVMHAPPEREGLVGELLFEEKLIMVTTRSDGVADPESYVYVDWGERFAVNHDAAHPEMSNPAVAISLGPLALTYLLSVGGCGYFRAGTAQTFLDDGRLYRVEGAPEFSHSAYVVYAAQRDNPIMNHVRLGLRATAQCRSRTAADNITAVGAADMIW